MKDFKEKGQDAEAERLEKTIEIKLVAAIANQTTYSLIEFYNSHWKNLGRKDVIKFNSYIDLMIP